MRERDVLDQIRAWAESEVEAMNTPLPDEFKTALSYDIDVERQARKGSAQVVLKILNGNYRIALDRGWRPNALRR